jgi:hypothetical protein
MHNERGIGLKKPSKIREGGTLLVPNFGHSIFTMIEAEFGKIANAVM